MRIRDLALAGAMLAFTAPFSAALAEDLMANTYANTVTTTNKATGVKGTLLFNQGGIYSASTTGSDGKPLAYTGTWTTKDDGKTVCLAIDAAPNGPAPPAPSCSPLSPHNVGDSWTVTNTAGETFDVGLTAGR